MRVKHQHIDFKISRRTLWVGMQAYPLHMITRVRPIEIIPNRTRMATTYAKRMGATVGLGALGMLFLGCLGTSAPPALWAALVVLVLGLLVVHTVRLVRRLKLAHLYILSVDTAGTAHAALVSTDKSLIYDLTHRVVDAIDNPALEFAIKVDHLDIVQGDKILGDKFSGDKVAGDKILDGWS